MIICRSVAFVSRFYVRSMFDFVICSLLSFSVIFYGWTKLLVFNLMMLSVSFILC